EENPPDQFRLSIFLTKKVHCDFIDDVNDPKTRGVISTAMAKTISGEVQLHAQVDGKEIVITESSVRRDLQLADKEGIDCLPNYTIFKQLALMRKPKRKDTQVPQPSVPTESVVDKTVHKELGDRLVRAATTASSLRAEQDNANITKTQSKATPNESSFQGTKVESSDDEESLGKDASKQERRIDVIDVDEDITLDKGKGIMIEEPVKPKKKDQIRLDEEAALKLQAEFDKEERLAREEAKKNKKPILL
nr:hypothetical protein [Tanacetum cinerariifolium]